MPVDHPKRWLSKGIPEIVLNSGLGITVYLPTKKKGVTWCIPSVTLEGVICCCLKTRLVVTIVSPR